MIAKCSNPYCHHPSQDKLHGKGVRVHNPYFKPSPGGLRCTVCGSQMGYKREEVTT